MVIFPRFLYVYQAGSPSVFVSPGSGSGVGKSPSDAGADPDESQAFSADVLWQPLWFSERDADATNAGFLYDIYSLLKPAPFKFYSLYVSH